MTDKLWHGVFSGLKRNPKKIQWKDGISLLSLFAPGILFVACLLWAYYQLSEFHWLGNIALYPWEFWGIAICGIIATLGGIGDWVFHRVFIAVGPKEHKSHVLALATGGIPLFILMAWASISKFPHYLLIPIIAVALYTTVLICYDEFVFHRVRCKAIETLLHRLLVFGNGFAWLAWMHWCFVRKFF